MVVEGNGQVNVHVWSCFITGVCSEFLISACTWRVLGVQAKNPGFDSLYGSVLLHTNLDCAT